MYLFGARQKAVSFLKACNARKVPVKLHIGCGANYKDGWINMDYDRHAQRDMRVDVRQGIPFPDCSVDYIFNEHFIEHLSYEDGLAFMKECYRVLKPMGVLRTAFPDMDTLIKAYQDDTWRNMEWVRLAKAEWFPSGCYMLNTCIREGGGHLYMYTAPEMKRRLIEAGFGPDAIIQCDVRSSRHPELLNAERRADSTVIEATK